jgi:hypothetical protein
MMPIDPVKAKEAIVLIRVSLLWPDTAHSWQFNEIKNRMYIQENRLRNGVLIFHAQ